MKYGIFAVTSAGGNIIAGPIQKTTKPKNEATPSHAQALLTARTGAELISSQVHDITKKATYPNDKLWNLKAVGINSDESSPKNIRWSIIITIQQ